LRKPFRKSLVLVSLLGAAVALIAATSALAVASISILTDSVAHIGTGGKTVVVTGSATCTAGHKLKITLAMVQRTTGAYAAGNAPSAGNDFTCSGSAQRWTISGARAESSPAFVHGAAQVCLIATTAYKKIGATGLFQSCKTVNIAAGT
jgi:hypothetical protein